MIRTVGTLVGATGEAEALARGYESGFAPSRSRSGEYSAGSAGAVGPVMWGYWRRSWTPSSFHIHSKL